MVAAADNDVIVKDDAKLARGRRKLARDRDVLSARLRIAARMIVDHPYGPHNVLIYMIYFA